MITDASWNLFRNDDDFRWWSYTLYSELLWWFLATGTMCSAYRYIQLLYNICKMESIFSLYWHHLDTYLKYCFLDKGVSISLSFQHNCNWSSYWWVNAEKFYAQSGSSSKNNSSIWSEFFYASLHIDVPKFVCVNIMVKQKVSGIQFFFFYCMDNYKTK